MTHQSMKNFALSLRGEEDKKKSKERPFITSLKSPSLLTNLIANEGRGRSREKTTTISSTSSESNSQSRSKSLASSHSYTSIYNSKTNRSHSSDPAKSRNALPPPPISPLLNILAPNSIVPKSKFSDYSHGIINISQNINKLDISKPEEKHVTFDESNSTISSPPPPPPSQYSSPLISSLKLSKNVLNNNEIEIYSYSYEPLSSSIPLPSKKSEKNLSKNKINKLLTDNMNNNSPYIFTIISQDNEDQINNNSDDEDEEQQEYIQEDDNKEEKEISPVKENSNNNISPSKSFIMPSQVTTPSTVNSSLSISPPNSTLTHKNFIQNVTTPVSSPQSLRKVLENSPSSPLKKNKEIEKKYPKIVQKLYYDEMNKSSNPLSSSPSTTFSSASPTTSFSAPSHSSTQSSVKSNIPSPPSSTPSSPQTKSISNKSLHQLHQQFHQKKLIEQQEQYKKQKELRQEIRSLTFSQLQTELENYTKLKNMNSLERINKIKELQNLKIALLKENSLKKQSNIKNFKENLAKEEIIENDITNNNLKDSLYKAEIRRLINISPDFQYNIPDSPAKEEVLSNLNNNNQSNSDVSISSNLINTFSSNINRLKEQYKNLRDQQSILENKKLQFQQQIQRESWNQLKKHDELRMFNGIPSTTKINTSSTFDPKNSPQKTTNEVINSQSLEQQVEFCEKINFRGRLRTESFNKQLKMRIDSRKF